MGDISTHFSIAEFRRRGDPPVPPGVPARELLARLEALRCIVGQPLRIVSGYRTPASNAAVGGARNSRHMVGDAADLVGKVVTLAQAERAGFRGIGTKNGYATHVDCRPVPARWTY